VQTELELWTEDEELLLGTLLELLGSLDEEEPAELLLPSEDEETSAFKDSSSPRNFRDG
jgi:hypothetical protein